MMLSANVLCIKKKKKKSYFLTKDASNERTKRSASGPATMLQITEDTPPDMLAGAMDLTVLLPTGRTAKMSVERSTPMMDLLVQITNNSQLQLSGYTLQALGMAPSQPEGGILPYKPNTPIGALDTQCIRVIPKNRSNVTVPKNVPPGHQPFENTFRLKVHLPRNQLFVTRVSQRVLLEDILKKVCEEKNLEEQKYEFRHPANLDECLDPKLTLSDYAITEIYLVSKGSLNQTFSSGDIMALRKEEERKQLHNKTGGGVFNLIFRRGKSSPGSLSSENRSISPTHSDDSNVTPPAQPIAVQEPVERPKPPQRRKKPAPKPPKEKKETLTICHSRNSSDSSGYHEASVLSENNTSLPRRPKSTIISEEASQSTNSLGQLSARSKSTSNLTLPSRKKKSAPAPPAAPVLEPEPNPPLEEPKPSPVVASQSYIESTTSIQPTPFESLNSLQSLPDQKSEVDHILKTQENTELPNLQAVIADVQTPEHTTLEEPQKQPDINLEPLKIETETDWQYQLPSPPKAFRDSSPVPVRQSVTDSVVTSPELFEKLAVVKNQSEVSEVASEEEKPILNKLSLENLEKRRSLVYNRELATSLKMSDADQPPETLASSFMSFEKTYNEVKQSSPKTSTLPNFKITTYNNPKQGLHIFEDETIRSGNKLNLVEEKPLQKDYIGRSMENISFKKNSSEEREYKFYKPAKPLRSESFSKGQNWTPSKPVTRSKSQLILNKNREVKNVENNTNLTKTNSLYDVSGLQSLEVIRSIQHKLNTPNNSTEHLEKEESYQKQPEIKTEVQKPRKYQPPAINMSTWSDRPKVPVNVKEDPDYKHSNSKIIVNTVNNEQKSNDSIEIRNNSTNGVSVKINNYSNRNVVKVNGSEPISQNRNGNVVIKIEGENVTLRRPFRNINSDNPRPHSTAFGTDFGPSTKPVVTSVELKKPYKDNQPKLNTSVTHIYQPEPKPKRFYPVNSFTPPQQITPVVRNFRNVEEPQNSWIRPNSNTLPTNNVSKTYALTAPRPFSQSNLRRTNTSVERSDPPPPPMMPRGAPVKSAESANSKLLQEIRDFGGKKRLRAVTAS